MDPRARSRRGSYEGNYTSAPSASRTPWNRRRETRRAAHSERESDGFRPAQGAAIQSKAAISARRTVKIANAKVNTVRDHHSGRRTARDTWSISTTSIKLRDKLLIDDLSFKLPPAALSASSSDRRRQDHAVPYDHGPEKPIRHHQSRRERAFGYSTRPVRDSLDGKKTVWEDISNGQEHHPSRQERK